MNKANGKRVLLAAPPKSVGVVALTEVKTSKGISRGFVVINEPKVRPSFQGRELITTAKGNFYPAPKTRHK